MFHPSQSLFIGVIEDVKNNKNGFEKYKIRFRTQDRKEHLFWSSWQKPEGYRVGHSIPIRVSNAFPKYHRPVSVNNMPQNNDDSVIAALALVGFAGLAIGYLVGRNKD